MIYTLLSEAEGVLRSMRKLPFEVGFCAGITTMLGYWLFSKWNSKLSILLNLSDVYFSFKAKKYHLGDFDLGPINHIRNEHEKLPMGNPTAIESLESKYVESSYTNGVKIPIHIYKPKECPKSAPIVVFIHGGGFVVGNTKMYEPIITYIADKTKSIVIGVDYRKAPENKFPAGVYDCLDAVRYIHSGAISFGGDPQRLAVVGDSAGGNLTIISSLELSSLVSLSIPIYPVTSFGMLTQSKLRNADAPILKAYSVDWYNMRYFRSPSDMLHPLANPMARGNADLKKAPRTHVITAEYDVLVDEGAEYANVLRNAGVEVTYKRYNNTVHGFFGSPLLTHGRAAMDDVCELIISHYA